MSTQASRRHFLSRASFGTSLLLAGCRRSGPSAAPAETPAGPADVTKDHTSAPSATRLRARTVNPPARRRPGHRGSVQRHRCAGARALARADHPRGSGWRGGREEPGGRGSRAPALPLDSGAIRRALRAYARDAHGGPARGTYTGQFAFVYIEPKSNPGRYDQEIFLATLNF
jgi:hypothetical protein